MTVNRAQRNVHLAPFVAGPSKRRCFVSFLSSSFRLSTSNLQLPSRASTAHAPHLIHQRWTRAGSPKRVWLRSQSAGDPSTLRMMLHPRALHRIGQRTSAWAWLTRNNTSTSTSTSTNTNTSINRIVRAGEVEGVKAGTMGVVDPAYRRALAMAHITRRQPCLRQRTAIKPTRQRRYKRPQLIP
jgi:hypothetical protein